LPVLSGSELTLVSSSGRFKIHYTMTGVDAVPNSAWVQTVAQTFDNVAASYTSLQWQLAPTSGNGPYDVYLRNLAPEGFYGVTNSGQSASTASHPNAFTSWMELDNNFTDSIYKPATYSPLQSLQITAAHEYHHAIQYGYNYYFDIWYAEATSTWMEDELYDSVNQLYSYIPAWFTQSKLSLDSGADTSTGGGYGRWIFNRYLTEKHGSATVRTAWEYLVGISSPGGSDISMTPVLGSVLSSAYSSSLENDFFGFAKRAYTRDWASHTSDIASIHPYSPVTTYSAYPVNNSSSQNPSISLPHYSFAYYTFKPATGVPSLTITVTKSAGIQTAAFRKSSGTITEIIANVDGSSYTDNAFSSADEVVLLIANTSGTYEGANASFNTDSSSSQKWTVTVNSDSNGTVTCTTPVDNGATSSCSVIPSSGYLLDTITDNSVDIKSAVTGGNYSIANVTANHVIAATFALNTSLPVNGVCGSSNAQSFASAPTTNLCSSGNSTTVTNTGTGPWNWLCSGVNNGNSVYCSANNQPASSSKCGDCNNDGIISISEVQKSINNFLGL
jgi:hypothetical protein